MHYQRRRIAAIAAACALAVSAAGCERTVTHEPGAGYSRIITAGSATYGSASGAPDAYRGETKARAAYAGTGNPASTIAWGSINTGNLDADGTYGAAFYFPRGTFTGSQPAQNGAVDIMRWIDGSNHGSVRISADHRASLVLADGSEVEENKEFVLREECWNWVVVRQQLSTTDGAAPLNQVYLNGSLVASSAKRNTAAPLTGGVDNVRYGLVRMGADQTRPLTFYVDDAYVSSETAPRPPAPGAALCDPLPNVLFIVTDDQRAGTVGDLDPTTDSPNDLDTDPANDYWMPNTVKWFRTGDGSTTGGTEFSNATATTPTCCPARASILTGLYAHNHRVQRNDQASLFDPLSALNVRLADTGSVEAPYATGIFGKYLNAWDLNHNPPAWDRWAIYNNGVHTPDSTAGSCRHPSMPPGPITTARGMNCINEQGTLRGWPYAPAPYGEWETAYLGDKAVDFIDANEADDERPWFMYVAPTIPHIPFAPEPGKYAAPDGPVPPPFPNPEPPNFMEADLTGKPPYVQAARVSDRATAKTTMSNRRERQLRMLRSVDDMVDRVFTRLTETGEADNTLAVFISDNGYLWGEHWLEKKPYPYLPDAQVPMYARWPGHIAANATDARPVANVDVAPTVLSAAGLAGAETMDGINLLDPLESRTRVLTEARHEANPTATMAPDWAALTTPPPPPGDTATPHYHYIEHYDDFGEIVFREYYDLRLDPFELVNRYGADGDPANDPATNPRASALSTQLRHARSCAGATCP